MIRTIHSQQSKPKTPSAILSAYLNQNETHTLPKQTKNMSTKWWRGLDKNLVRANMHIC